MAEIDLNKSRICRNCIFWDALPKQELDPRIRVTPLNLGLCRVSAPICEKTRRPHGYNAFWPTTEEDDWCGRHQRKPSELGDTPPFGVVYVDETA